MEPTDSASIAESSEEEGFNCHERSPILDDLERMNLSDPRTFEDFRLRWDPDMQGEQMAVLQHLAACELRHLPYHELKFFINKLVEAEAQNPQLSEGDGNYNPIHVALRDENSLFLEAFFDTSNPTPTTIEYTIDKPWKKIPTLLHLAIWMKSPFTAQIIASCPPEHPAFLVKDSNYHTPLHLGVAPVDKQVSPERKSPEQTSTALTGMGPKSEWDWKLRRKLPTFSSYDTVRQLIAKCPEALLVKDSERFTPYQYRLWGLEEAIRSKDLSTPETLNISKSFQDDAVASYIRAHVIRTFPTEQAMTVLYPPGQERDITFDLSGSKRTLSDGYLEQLGRNVRHERVLKWVVLPNLKFESLGNTAYATTKKFSYPGQSRRDAFRIFSWLRKRNVHNIIEVIVDDLEECYHSDETIENALQGFEIESWDWRRNDIPSSVIANSSSVLKSLRLYFSGEESVLDDWSGNKGFGNDMLFAELQTIYVIDNSSQAKRLQVLEGIDTFRRKIQSQTNGSIKVHFVPGIHGMEQGSKAKTSENDLQTANLWLKPSADFAKLLRTAPDSHNISPIKVAIISDGIDASLKRFEDRIAVGISYHLSDNSKDTTQPYYIPSGKSGTIIATLICEICPKISLYIARVDEHVNGRRQFSTSSIAKAIAWAINCNVDIICVGCRLSEKSSPFDHTPEIDLRRAAYEASKRSIPIFWSMSGTDRRSDSRLWRDIGCFRIGVANPDQFKQQGDEDFLLPLHNVPFVDDDGEIISHESGEILATGLASGLTGLLRFCNNLLDDNKVALTRLSYIESTIQYMSHQKSIVDFLPEKFREALAKAGGKDYDARNLNDLSTMVWSDQCREALEYVMYDFKKVFGV